MKKSTKRIGTASRPRNTAAKRNGTNALRAGARVNGNGKGNGNGHPAGTEVRPVIQVRKQARRARIGVGVIGCGYWGPNLVRNLNSLGDCSVVSGVKRE